MEKDTLSTSLPSMKLYYVNNRYRLTLYAVNLGACCLYTLRVNRLSEVGSHGSPSRGHDFGSCVRSTPSGGGYWPVPVRCVT